MTRSGRTPTAGRASARGTTPSRPRRPRDRGRRLPYDGLPVFRRWPCGESTSVSREGAIIHGVIGGGRVAAYACFVAAALIVAALAPASALPKPAKPGP